MLLPDQPGPVPQLAVAAPKYGRLFIMNRSPGQMGGFVAGGRNKPSQIELGGCWCGPSYFTGSDGIGRVVTSQGNVLNTWRVNTALKHPLILEGASTLPSSIQDPGFFTSVSSNGTQSGTAIIWAVLRPTSAAPPNLTLYAFSAAPTVGALPVLYSAVAGTWPNLGGNANIVPVVANGNVYVTSYQTLTIFGLLSSQSLVKRGVTPQTEAKANPLAASTSREPAGPEIFGTVTHRDGEPDRRSVAVGKERARRSDGRLQELPDRYSKRRRECRGAREHWAGRLARGNINASREDASDMGTGHSVGRTTSDPPGAGRLFDGARNWRQSAEKRRNLLEAQETRLKMSGLAHATPLRRGRRSRQDHRNSAVNFWIFLQAFSSCSSEVA